MSKEGEAGESLDGLRLLLVEDDPLVCLDLESSLSDLGAAVVAVSHAAAALKAMASATYDFAILDFELGVGTSEAIAAAAVARAIPFVFLSGYSEDDERFSRWPRVAVLVKPISAGAIARHIVATLSGRS